MTNAIDVSAVHNSRLGTDLSEAECKALGEVMSVHELAEGAVLAREGDSDQKLYVLARGSLDVLRQEGDNAQHLHTMQKGELAGVTGLLSDASHRTTLRARWPQPATCSDGCATCARNLPRVAGRRSRSASASTPAP